MCPHQTWSYITHGFFSTVPLATLRRQAPVVQELYPDPTDSEGPKPLTKVWGETQALRVLEVSCVPQNKSNESGGPRDSDQAGPRATTPPGLT